MIYYVSPVSLMHAVPEEPLTLFDVMSKVALACFYWGLGTALGELPPYFVAKAARRCVIIPLFF